ncbi:MAG: hypothetical protein R3E95_22520 [Thiolinea sp.]
MAKPIPKTQTQPLTFDQRLTLVQTTIKARTATYPAKHQNAARARLWVSWIKRNLLQDQPAPVRSLQPIQTDLYPWRAAQ